MFLNRNDGGRKLYTPIWGDLETYQLEMKNPVPLGVHKINMFVSISVNLDDENMIDR